VMTALRTMWGIDLEKIRGMGAAFAGHFERSVQAFLANQTVEQSGETYRLTASGKFLADGIAAELFLTEGGA